jgi:UDP-2,3-diacylglucosamine hydrolase
MTAAADDAVLGTRVFVLAGGDGSPAFVLSDLHVPAGGGAVVDALAAWLACARDRRARVFVLGDLFDSYVSARQLRVGVWRDVADLFARAVHAGVELHVLHGNRDFLLGREFEAATGGRVVPGGIRCRLAGRSALLLHGDELCQNDLPYQRAKRWLRSRPVRALARCLPLRASLALAERARRRSREVVASGDPRRFAPTAAAVGAAFANGVDLLVFGHIHRPARGPFAAGEYCVLPAFDADGTGLFADAGELTYAQCRDRAVARQPDPPPRTFA